MSTDPDPQVQNPNDLIEQARKHINLMYNEVTRLTEQDLPPADYYGEFLKRVLGSMSAPAGAVWVKTPQGHLQLQYQVNLKEVGLEKTDAKESHDELLRQAFQQGRPFYLPPQSSIGTAQGGGPAAGNPSDFLVLLTPIRMEQQVVGIVEVWQRPDHPPNAIPGFMQLLVRFSDLASQYARKNHMRTMMGQQQLWTQLEAFARQIHNSLNPTEVGYLIANEGRRLIECDRLSVVVRQGKRRAVVEAVSGADVVEKRSNLIQLMRNLCEQVLEWGDKLVYKGVRDESLPPAVIQALDDYLQESPSKLLAILPLRDDREKDTKKPPRSALVMESFEPTVAAEQLITRLEVIGKHATGALYNAVEHRRIPLRWLWQPLARLQEGLGGPARAMFAGAGVLVGLILGMLVFVPYPLKMDAKGQVLPEKRGWLYTPLEAQVVGFEEGVAHGNLVGEKQPLILMRDTQLEIKLVQLTNEILAAQSDIDALTQQYNSAKDENERLRINAERRQKVVVADSKGRERRLLIERTNADQQRPGYFRLKSPLTGKVLSWDFRETLTNRFVKPSEPLLRIGDEDKGWEVELKIPQKHIGQILQAYKTGTPDEVKELDVDLLVISAPTQVFKGKLSRDKIAGEANPNKDEATESEPVVLASVRIVGDDIPKADRIPRNLLMTGTEVHSKVRCRNRSLGYSLFYGFWEFFYEKVVFFF